MLVERRSPCTPGERPARSGLQATGTGGPCICSTTGALASTSRNGPGYAFNDRLGILFGSLASAVCGYLVLRRALKQP